MNEDVFPLWEDDMENIFKAEYEVVDTITHKGYRDSLGVPEEPDEHRNVCQVETIKIFGVDITRLFDTNTMSEDSIHDETYAEGQKLMEYLLEIKG